MAEEVNPTTNPVPNPVPRPDTNSGLGDFIESLKKNMYGDKNEKVGVPENFSKELKELNKTIGVLSTKTANNDASLKSIEKNTFAAKALLKSIDKQTAGIVDIKKLLTEQINTPSAVGNIEAAQSTSAVDTAAEALAVKQLQPVAIVDIKDEAIRKLEGLLNKLNISAKSVANPAAGAGGGGSGLAGLFSGILSSLFSGAKNLKSLIFDPLKKLIFNPVTGLIASIGLGIASWFDEGPLKGAKELISKLGIKEFGAKALTILSKKFGEWATKLLPEAGGEIAKTMFGGLKGTLGKLSGSMAKFLGKALRFIPFVSSLIDIGDAVSRMLKGDYVGGLLSFGAAIAGVIPGVGQAISIAISIVNAGRDLSSGGVKENAKSGVNVKLDKVWKWLVDKLAVVMGYYFDKISDGWDYMKKGDYAHGLVTWASIIPSLGWMTSMYDWLVGTPEKIGDTGKKEPAEKGFLSKIWTWLQKSMAEKFDDVKNAVVGVFTSVGTNIVEGITTVANWFKSIGESIASFVDDPIKALTAMWESVKEKIKGIISAPIDMIKSGWNKVTSMFGGGKPEAVADSKPAIADSKVTKVAPATAYLQDREQKDYNARRKSRAEYNEKVLGIKPSLFIENDEKGIHDKMPEESKSGARAEESSPSRITSNTFAKFPSHRGVRSAPVPAVPLDIPSAPSPAIAIKDINTKLATAVQPPVAPIAPATGASSNVVSSNQTNSTTTTINSNSIDRDIPYIERNKYRQQVAYFRNLL